MKKLTLFVAGALIAGALASCEKEDLTANEQTQTNASKNMTTAGSGGSMAQFTVVDDFLYTIDYKTLSIFSLSDPDNPSLETKIDMGVGMETVFHQDGRLFIGANDGVHIYDISNPRNPMETSSFEHVTSCDPVIANHSYALSTLRGGTACGGNLSQLDVIDITDINEPMLIGEVALDNPYGLGFSNVDASIIYVCDGTSGLKAYSISNPANPKLLMTHNSIEAMDVIADGSDNLIVLSRNGIYQFDASTPTSLIQRSFIPVQ